MININDVTAVNLLCPIRAPDVGLKTVKAEVRRTRTEEKVTEERKMRRR